jgi:hypothetical protein
MGGKVEDYPTGILLFWAYLSGIHFYRFNSPTPLAAQPLKKKM